MPDYTVAFNPSWHVAYFDSTVSVVFSWQSFTNKYFRVLIILNCKKLVKYTKFPGQHTGEDASLCMH